MPYRRTILLAAALVVAAGAASAQQAPPQRLRGSIEAIEAQNLKLKSREGPTIDIKLTYATAVVGVVKASLADVQKDKFVGIAAMPQPDGTQRALEVLVFPEAARGSNEGHYPWDLQPESTMTNANVAETVERVEGPVLTLKYKDGEKKIFVPKEAPIVTFDKADRSDLKAGAHVMVVAAKQPDGSFTANRVLVGKNGVVPPM
jgi:uncharacterized protein DUF5666